MTAAFSPTLFTKDLTPSALHTTVRVERLRGAPERPRVSVRPREHRGVADPGAAGANQHTARESSPGPARRLREAGHLAALAHGGLHSGVDGDDAVQARQKEG